MASDKDPNDFGQNDVDQAGMKVFIFTMVFTIGFFIALIFLSKGIDLKEINESAKATPGGAAPTQKTAELDMSTVKEPWIATPEIAAHGKQVFQTSCAMCHGAEGKGDGVAGASLNPKPRNLVEGKWKKGGTSLGLYLELRHDAFEQAHQLTLCAHQFATQTSQRRRGVVSHRAVAIDCAIDRIFFALRGDETKCERKQVRRRHRGPTRIVERRLRAPTRPQQRSDRGKLRAVERRAFQSEPRECLVYVRNRLRIPSTFATQYSAHRLHAREFRHQPFAIGARTQQADGGGTER